MADTSIEWTDKVWNCVTGCTKVSQGCKFCYAETIAKRFWKDRKFTDVQLHPERLEQPLHWKKPAMIFVNSMSDLFHEKVPFEFILKVYKTISASSRHTYQILTKRPERMLEFYKWFESKKIRKREGELWKLWLHKTWIGVSVEDQKTADERREYLKQIPAVVRFVSYEPALGNVNWKGWEFLNWFIAGGESGRKARPAHPNWFRNARDFCKGNNIPFFFKQWGEWGIINNNQGIFLKPNGIMGNQGEYWEGKAQAMKKLGKNLSGNFLDGKQHLEHPKV
jgi:protein gp37